MENPNDRLKSQHQLRVEDFMHKASQVLPPLPTMPDWQVRILRVRLLISELLEFAAAADVSIYAAKLIHANGGKLFFDDLEFQAGDDTDMVEYADGLADLSVVTIGAMSAAGIADGPLLHEVDRSNLDKFRGDAHLDEHGKWIKPSDWQPPNIKAVLLEQGYAVGG